MAINTTATLAQINGLATELGLDNWQIQQASWNGYIFSTVSSNIISNLGTGLGPISTVASATANIIEATSKVIGADSLAGNVPAGSKLQAMNTIDRFQRKHSINDLPNGKDNIRGLGYNGQEITIIGIAWGSNYLSALKNNLVSMFYSDEIVKKNNPEKYHVLNHPFFGQLDKCWLLDMRVIHSSTSWRAAVYELKFRTEEPIINTKGTRSTTQIINDTISGILGASAALNTLWQTFGFIQTNSSFVKSFKNNIFIQNDVQNVQTQVLASVNNTVNVTKLITKNLAPVGYNNVQLNNYVTTTSSLPQLSYFQGNLTPNDVNNINIYLARNINKTISTIYALQTTDFYDTIDYLKILIAQVASLSITLLNSFYGEVQEYVVPYNMSLFQACNINNIPYQANVAKIIGLNQNRFFWLNNLNKGDVILLPNGA